jgi:hypothetical protein
VKHLKLGPFVAAALAVTALGAAVPAPALAASAATASAQAALAGAPGTFVPLTPVRILDTRHGNGAPTAKIGSGRTVSFTVTGRGGVPASNVAAVVINVTVADGTASGFVTAFPGGAVKPAASNLNFAAGQVVANLVTVGVGGTGQVSLYNGSRSSVDLIADVSGYYLGGTPTDPGAFTALTPTRILDTRTGLGAQAKPLHGGGKLDLTVQGAGGVDPAGAAAVVMNVTATSAVSSGYLTVYPAGGVRPTASNLNFTAGRTVPNLVTVALGTSGQVTIYNGSSGSVNVIADVAGYYLTGTATKPGTFVPLPKTTRILDTRAALGAPGKTAVLPLHEVGLQTLNGNSVPLAGVAAVALNVTATGATRSGYVSVSPTDPKRPAVSTLNHAAGQTIANAAIVPPGLCGKSTFFNGSSGSTHLIADVAGYFIGAAAGGGPSSKTAKAWGINAQGLLADGSTKSSKAPVDVMDLQGLVQIGNGLALDNTGAVWAWGPGELTRLYGAGTSVDQGFRNCSIPESVTGLTNITAIAGSPNLGYALDNAGKVWSWGLNSKGQLGNGTLTTNFTPQKVPGLPPTGTSVTQLGNGFVVLSNGNVWGWGDNSAGQLGTGATIGVPSKSPMQVLGLSNVKALSQQGHTEYALLNDDTVMAWGANINSALGAGMVPDTLAHPSPRHVVSVTDPAIALSGVTAISGAMALMNDGSLVTWGANDSGQLGDSSIGVTKTRPVLVTFATTPPTFSGIATGGNVNFALATDSTVWAWGAAFGNGRAAKAATPFQIPGLSGVTSMGGAASTGYAIVP